MAFSEQIFVGKVADLIPTQQNIQTLSLWLIHHRKNVDQYAVWWLNELKKAVKPRKLAFIYLANDVLQNGKKKGGDRFISCFAAVLPDAFKNTASEADPEMLKKLQRIIDIWGERKILSTIDLTRIKNSIESTSNVEPVNKKKRIEEVKKALQEQMAEKSPEESSDEVLEADDISKLIAALITSASSDAEVRQKIANLPQAVTDASGLKRLKGKAEAEELSKTVEEASQMLDEYNERLNQEMSDRKKLSTALKAFITSQKDKLAESQIKLQEYRQKLENVGIARRELDDHIKNLPDLTKLPDVDAGLAPLPSAGDLFSF